MHFNLNSRMWCNLKTRSISFVSSSVSISGQFSNRRHLLCSSNDKGKWLLYCCFWWTWRLASIKQSFLETSSYFRRWTTLIKGSLNCYFVCFWKVWEWTQARSHYIIQFGISKICLCGSLCSICICSIRQALCCKCWRLQCSIAKEKGGWIIWNNSTKLKLFCKWKSRIR